MSSALEDVCRLRCLMWIKGNFFSEITLVRDLSRQPKTLSLLNILSILGRDYYLRPFFVVIVFFGAKRTFVVEII